jgi:hypothetical protein
MNNKPKPNHELYLARYVAEAAGDQCGTVFVTKQIMLRKNGTHTETFGVTAFHNDAIAAHIQDHPRLDRAGLEAVRKFEAYIKENELDASECQGCYGNDGSNECACLNGGGVTK